MHVVGIVNLKEPGGTFFEFLNENWWKGVLLYQTISVKAIFFLAHYLEFTAITLFFNFNIFYKFTA